MSRRNFSAPSNRPARGGYAVTATSFGSYSRADKEHMFAVAKNARARAERCKAGKPNASDIAQMVKVSAARRRGVAITLPRVAILESEQ
jgi:hypothetical protein